MRVLCSGGIGDSVMAYAKMKSHKMPEGPHLITHVEAHEKSLPLIKEFYSSQGLNVDVKFQRGICDWYWNDPSRWDIAFSSRWNGKGGFPGNDWEINPFPPFSFKKESYSAVIQVSAGRNQSRYFDFWEVLGGVHSHNTVAVGVSADYRYNHIDDSRFLVNRTTFTEFINIVCSCSIFIGHAGFGAYLAAMSGARCYVVLETCSSNYLHPMWNIVPIRRLSDV